MKPLFDRIALKNEFDLLYLNYHRNKNQHGSATWFKYLNLMVRHLRKLLSSKCETFQRKSLMYLKGSVIPKLYYAFNTVIAQGQYITLGFALVGSLAKVYSLVSSVDLTQGISILNRMLSDVSVKERKELLLDLEVGQTIGVPLDAQDLGEEISMEQLSSINKPKLKRGSDVMDNIFGSDKKKSKKEKKDKKDKKKKKKSLIDEIFG